MITRAFHAFEQKLIYFEDDIELIDIIRTCVINGDLTDNQSTNVLKNIDSSKHKHISRRKNSDGSRALIINHLRVTLRASYVKDVYEELTQYMRFILEGAAQNGFDAGRIIGEHSFKLDAKVILASGNWEDIVTMITDSVFQNLESEKSTLKLLKKISNKLALDIDDEIIEAALPYLESRHYFVHTDGKASQEFISKYPIIKIKKGRIQLNDVFINNLRGTVMEVVKAFDKAIIDANLLAFEDTLPYESHNGYNK